MTIQWKHRDDITDTVRGKIIPTHIVMDVGAGIRPQTFFTPAVHLIVEPFLPYIDAVYRDFPPSSRKLCLHGTWDTVLPMFADKSVDTIFALDVIEHLDKSDGHAFLTAAQRIARRQVVIFTPLGFFPQNYDDNDLTDRWGMQGGYWQSHRSGWQPDDFSPDWEIIACEDFHLVDQHESPLDDPHGAFWAIRTFSNDIAPARERLVIAEAPRALVHGCARLKQRIRRAFFPSCRTAS